MSHGHRIAVISNFLFVIPRLKSPVLPIAEVRTVEFISHYINIYIAVSYLLSKLIAQSAGAVEYTDSFSAEE